MDHAVPMRDLSEFCDQLGEMQQCFSKLDNCERTIALYYLMVGLPYANARFLQRALEEAISKVITPESQVLERNANDPAFISTFLLENPAVALSKMLAHIPLLRPGNKEALKGYITALRRFLSDCVAPTYKIYNECVEILSYVFVHPAFGREDKKFFRHLLYYVVQPNFLKYFARGTSSGNDDISSNSESSSSSTGAYLNTAIDNDRLNRRSNSLTPGQFSSRDKLIPENWSSSQENLSPPLLPKPRSYSLSNDKALPLKTSSIQTSSSETRLQDLQVQHNCTPTVKGIVCWLKSLRLHKYSWVFNNLSYDQMLNLTEPELEALGITKGARHKILLSIAKLKERGHLLTELETEIMNGGDLLSALKKLKTVLQSPLQTTAGEDLPSQFVRVMGKVCTQLLMLRSPSEDCLVLFSTLCERAETSDAFTEEQKKRLGLWRGQMIRGNHVPSYTHRQQSNNYKQQNMQSQHHISAIGTAFHQSYAQKSSSYPNMQGSPVVGAHRHSLGSTTLQNQLYKLTSQFCPTNPIIPFSIDLQNTLLGSGCKNNEINSHHHHHYHHHHHTETKTRNTQGLKNTDIESSLESLCLQMMEHALGP